jgi:hypothetical protein
MDSEVKRKFSNLPISFFSRQRMVTLSRRHAKGPWIIMVSFQDSFWEWPKQWELAPQRRCYLISNIVWDVKGEYIERGARYTSRRQRPTRGHWKQSITTRLSHSPSGLEWIHSIWLKVDKKVPHQQTILERVAQGDKSARFQQEDDMKGFRVMNPRKFSKDEVFLYGGDDSRSEIERIRKPPKRPFGLRSCSEA